MALTCKEGCFSTGGKFTEVSVVRADHAVFWAEMWPRVDRTDTMITTFPHINAVSPPQYKMLQPVPATTLLLFGLVTVPCGLKFGTFLFHLVSEGSVLTVRLLVFPHFNQGSKDRLYTEQFLKHTEAR